MMNGFDGYDEKNGLHEDVFGPKTGNSIVQAFDAFRT